MWWEKAKPCKNLNFSIVCTAQYNLDMKTLKKLLFEHMIESQDTRLLCRSSRKLDENFRKLDFSFSTAEVLETAKSICVIGIMRWEPAKIIILCVMYSQLFKFWLWIFDFDLTFTANLSLNLEQESDNCHVKTGISEPDSRLLCQRFSWKTQTISSTRSSYQENASESEQNSPLRTYSYFLCGWYQN